jgi:predicted 3-demethylubiquinone-9 3-methyltransferase (glyoxalase superfamily)
MIGSIKPFLMFSGKQHGRAEEAINFYISIFPDSRITSMKKYGAGEQAPEGTVQVATFVLNGQNFMAIDSVVDHSFNFTPSISFFLTSKDLLEFDNLVTRLSEGGEMLMPPDNYGFSSKFSWFNDRFGVSWQVNYE